MEPETLKPSSPMPIIAFVLSLAFFIPFASVAAIIIAIVSLVKKHDRKGFSIAAVIIGSIVFLVQILFMLAIFGILLMVAPIAQDLSEMQDLPLDQAVLKCDSLSGTMKDVCIYTALSMHPEDGGKITKEYCESNIGLPDMQNFCFSFATGDKSYCEKITESGMKMKCLD